jgi:hypothetical protein
MAVTPFYWNFKKGSINQNIIFPVWWAHSDSLRATQVFFPIFWNLKNDSYRSTSFLPLFSFGKSSDSQRRHLAVTPLFWQIKSSEATKTVLFPVFDSKKITNGDSNLGIFYFLLRSKKIGTYRQTDFLYPICQLKTDTNLNYFRLFPIVWYKKTNDSRFISIQPFYYRNISLEEKETHILWQFLTFENRYNERKSWNFLWRAIFLRKFNDKGHEFRVMYFLFAEVKKTDYTEKSLFPLYTYTRESNGNKSFSALFYFYNSFKRKLPDSPEFYKEEKIFWFIRLRSNYKKLKAEGKIN